jgi:type IV pilus assembly protein PilM
MTKPKKIFVLDLGMQSMRFAEFSSHGSSELRLLRGTRRDFLLDPALESSRPEQIQAHLSEILRSWKVLGGDVTCILPAHTVFTRVVNLDVPPGAEGQLDAIIGFEAQQNIPFPLEEVVWDYCVMGTSATGGVTVVFVAVKTDLLEGVCGAVTRCGLRIHAISVAPLALYDAFRVTYPDLAGTQTTLLLDIGSRTTNMIVSGPDSFFSRSIPSGGLAVTTAISKEIHTPELDEAESVKLLHGSVGLGAGVEPPSDPLEANLSKIIRQAMLKIQADITRSLGHHRSTLSGTAPSSILITGGMAGMPYLAEFLTEKLQKEVEFFDPLRTVSVDEAVNSTAADFLDPNRNNLGELIGGALSITTLPHTHTKLLPPSVHGARELQKRLPFLGAAAALLLAVLVAWFGYAANAASLVSTETAALRQSKDEHALIASKIKALQSQEEAITKVSDEILGLSALRESYPAILADLNARLPDHYLWITEIQPVVDAPQRPGSAPGNKPGETGNGAVKAILVKGLYLNNARQASVIDDFVTSLQSSKIFAVEEKEKSKVITQRGSPNDDYWAYPFALRIPLRTPITPLP